VLLTSFQMRTRLMPLLPRSRPSQHSPSLPPPLVLAPLAPGIAMEKGTLRPRSRPKRWRPRRTKLRLKLNKSVLLPLTRPSFSSRNVRSWRPRHRRQQPGLRPCASSWRPQLHPQIGSSAHVLKRNKGSEGHTAVTSLSTLMAHLSPQRKSTAVKKWVMLYSPCCSEALPSFSDSRPISGSGDNFDTALGTLGAPPLQQPMAAG
jgi:hypothetical protein